MCIDKFHYKTHVDSWCRENCDPYRAKDLNGVNTESCEQTFKWVNKFTSVKSMSGPRFWMFFTYLFDLHNLSKQGNLRSTVHPSSDHRWAIVAEIQDFESLLLQTKVGEVIVDTDQEEIIVDNNEKGKNGTIANTEDNMIEDFEKLDLNQKQYVCEECGSKYKVPWTLKSHMTKKT